MNHSVGIVSDIQNESLCVKVPNVRNESFRMIVTRMLNELEKTKAPNP